ncbi:FAD-dependent oxidoreductase [Legionella dresdenensis]|uniref:FAD-dependent oxidoreductase n=1 Tax=Legionella dresdenensis TaxID=450200 RepID=A0ABV8CFW4_9GAMM
MSAEMLDVLVVGAGPVGLFCANELTRYGLKCRIIDKKEALSDKSKALGLHIRTLDVLEDCGLLDEFLKRGHKVVQALFKSNGALIASVDFSKVASKRHYLIDLPQDQTEKILHDNLAGKGINVEWQTELTALEQKEKSIIATLKNPEQDNLQVEASWIIACDGAHSTLRHLVNGDFAGSAYDQFWWLADLHIDWAEPEDSMVINISQYGPMACFPMGNKRYRLVMTAPGKSTEQPQFEDIVKEFNLRSADKAELSNPVWVTGFSIHHRQMQQYRYDRLFFAGDAAHIHSPMGGQGLNTGIQDIYNLVWKLALVQRNQAIDELLDTYHDERYPVGKKVLHKTDLMTKMILIKNDFLIKMRNHAVKFLTNLDYVKKTLTSDLAELNISYSKSAIVGHYGGKTLFKPGEYLPDFTLYSLDSEHQVASSAYKITNNMQHNLFLFIGRESFDRVIILDIVNSVAKNYQGMITVHLVMPDKVLSPESNVKRWMDSNWDTHKAFAIEHPTLMIVRPDKYIAYIQTPLDKTDLDKYLDLFFKLPPPKPKVKKILDPDLKNK